MSPLHDDYQSERDLRDIANNLAPALTTILDEVVVQRYGFILFLVDMKEGLMQYISDQDAEDAVIAIEMWVKRRKLDLENKKNEQQNTSEANPIKTNPDSSTGQ